MGGDGVYIRHFVWMLRRRLWLVAFVPVLAASSVWAVSKFVLKPVYNASTTLLVQMPSKEVTFENLLLTRSLAETYAKVAKDRAVLEGALAGLQSDNLTYEDLEKKVAISSSEALIFIKAEDRDQVVATAMVDAVTRSLQEKVLEFSKLDPVAVITPPTAYLVKPRAALNALVAFITTFLVSIGAAVFMEQMAATPPATDLTNQRRRTRPLRSRRPVSHQVHGGCKDEH